LTLVRSLAVETHENWLEQHRYLNMDDLREYPSPEPALPRIGVSAMDSKSQRTE
jgi:hypothetical protein